MTFPLPISYIASTSLLPMQCISSTISKNQELPIGLDYFRLRAEGVSLLQALSGNVWTDYNEHDPGVTILEALCYAITDLSNRARQPIPDLLARPPGTAPRAVAPLVPAPEAFANHPVTANDYRKIVLGDAQLRQAVRNVWIKPRRKNPGEYTVRVGLYYEANTPSPAVNRPALAGQVLSLLNQHRSLGEQFGKVVFLEPYLVGIGGRLEMQGTQLPEDVLTEALWRVYTILQPTVARHDQASWPNLPGHPEEILAGPLLEHELLLERDFAAQPRQMGAAQLHAELSTLPSLRGVDGLSLYEPGQDRPSVLIQVGKDQELLLDVEASLQRLCVSFKGVLVNVNPARVRHKFEQRRAEQQRALRRPLPTAAPAPAEPRPFLNLGHYDSIQHSFPAVYRLGPDGLPAAAPPNQRAQTWQLKGYLLFFEQLMANFCAQLSNAEALLSGQPVLHEEQLFAQRPVDVPSLDYLLDEPGRPRAPQAPDDRTPDLPGYSAVPDTTPDFNHSYLHKLAEDPSALRRRRDALLTHLLARFAYVIAPFHPAPSDPDGIPAHSLQVRENLLRHLNTVISHRGAARVAFDLLPRTDASPYDVSGLELFLYLLTGIRYFELAARHKLLTMLEKEVWLDQSAAGPTARLVVHGAELDFPTFLAVQQSLLADPSLGKSTESGRLSLADENGHPTGLELELLTAQPTPGNSAPQQVMRYLARLDEYLNRFILLDHCTLQSATPAPAADKDESYSPYEFQISVCLAAFTSAFQPRPGAPANTPSEYQEYVQNLILTHAPAHLLVHIIWLDFEEMKDLEGRYEGFVAAGGLRLGDASRNPTQLLEKQQNLLEFLRPHF
ncbi:hypothetical protein GCM10022409_48020 [Hymenobacter glaciei]|uniref:Uncharacterized protein n=1 Tax=Hymenobacter glaciei TaxID=877209 RepID=A0ABP7UXU8_9BACT